MVLPSIISGVANQRELRANANGGRLTWSSDTVLKLLQYSGEVVEVNESLIAIPAAGLSVDISANVIAADGTDSAVPPSASTLYYVFLSNERTTDPTLASQLRLGPTTSIASTTSAQRYLGTTGDRVNWRVVGQAYVSAAGTFVDTPTQRYVSNFENQIPLSLRCVPGYNNNNAQTTITIGNANFARLNAGTNDTVEFLCDGYGPVWLSQNCVVSAGTAAGVSQWGIGIDSTSACTVAAQIAAAAVNVNAPCSHVALLSAGYHYAAMLAATGIGATYVCDLVRAGSAADPAATHLAGWVMG